MGVKFFTLLQLCCLVSLAEWVIAPHLMFYFTWWYYGSTHVKAWYLSVRRTLVCVLCHRASSLLRPDTCVFCWCSDLISLSHTHTHTHIHIHTHTYIHTHTHRAHSGASRLAHPYKIYIYRALPKHFCWPPFFMKDWILWSQAIITQFASAQWSLSANCSYGVL